MPGTAMPGTVTDRPDRAPRARVDKAQRAVVVDERQRALVGTEIEADQAVAVAAHHADRRRALEQRGEQVAARLQRVVAAPRPGARAAASGPGRPPRAPGRRAAARRRPRLRARRLPRWSSATAPGDHRHHKEAADARKHHAQAAMRTLARRSAARSRKARSVALSSASWSVAQSSAEARRAPR